MIARYFPLAGSLLVCHARAVCQSGPCAKGWECPGRQRALSVGLAVRRQMQAGHPTSMCKVHSLDQRDLLLCRKTRKPWAGEPGGGRQRKEVAFLSFVCNADQTDAGWPSSQRDEPDWAGGNTD